MYGKLFEQMYDGTLAVNWKGLVTFQQMIVLANDDGIVDMTADAMARRTGIPLDILEEGIAFLEMPDPHSRTPDREGRRIELIDTHRPWGWAIVNHKKYRDMLRREEKKAADRARIAEKRASEKSSDINNVAECRAVSPDVANVAHTDTYTDPPKSPKGDDFEKFFTAYPKKRSKGQAEKAWAKLKPNEHLVGVILRAVERAKTSAEWTRADGQYIPYPATWLNAKGWEDDIAQQPAGKRFVEVT